MSLAHLSIIEKDDLIKKMPKDALKRELREPSGNLPLFLIAARLKEVEGMEKEAMARQFSQESGNQEPTIAHRLAREVMPQAPLSNMAANPAPQPPPDRQGQMAQALAGPQAPLPTVYRNTGGLAALGGQAMPAMYEAFLNDPEMLMGAGLGPVLLSDMLSEGEAASAPASLPNPGQRPQLPPTVQIQPSQVPGSNAPVQISGGDTLPTVRAQSGTENVQVVDPVAAAPVTNTIIPETAGGLAISQLPSAPPVLQNVAGYLGRGESDPFYNRQRNRDYVGQRLRSRGLTGSHVDFLDNLESQGVLDNPYDDSLFTDIANQRMSDVLSGAAPDVSGNMQLDVNSGERMPFYENPRWIENQRNNVLRDMMQRALLPSDTLGGDGLGVYGADYLKHLGFDSDTDLDAAAQDMYYHPKYLENAPTAYDFYQQTAQRPDYVKAGAAQTLNELGVDAFTRPSQLQSQRVFEYLPDEELTVRTPRRLSPYHSVSHVKPFNIRKPLSAEEVRNHVGFTPAEREAIMATPNQDVYYYGPRNNRTIFASDPETGVPDFSNFPQYSAELFNQRFDTRAETAQRAEAFNRRNIDLMAQNAASIMRGRGGDQPGQAQRESYAAGIMERHPERVNYFLSQPLPPLGRGGHAAFGGLSGLGNLFDLFGPQSNIDPNAGQAQISGGNVLPVVNARTGLKGKYPGDAPRITDKMLAAAARRRKEKGDPRLYNQGRKVSFEETYKKGASPANQIAAMFGIPSAVADQEERVYGGMDTLPPYQPENNPLALRSKGFTSPTGTLRHGGESPDYSSLSGLDVLKMMKHITGDAGSLPTVFANEGYPPPDRVYSGDWRNLRPHTIETYRHQGLPVREASDLYTQGNTIINAARREHEFTEQDPERNILGTNPLETEAGKLLDVPEAETQTVGKRDVLTSDGYSVSANVTSPEKYDAVAPERTATSSAVPPSSEKTVSARSIPVPPVGSSSRYADLSAKLDKTLEKGPVSIPTVKTIPQLYKEHSSLIPDFSKERAKTTAMLEDAFKEEKTRDVVPKGLKDIRDMMDKRLKALDNSGLPFMTAAAAAIKGNQPILVALTNAMIGYTAGDEQLKKQGLSLMNDIAKMDIDIETLEAAQRDQVNKARGAMLTAREAEMKGDEDRAKSVLEVAAKAQTSARQSAIKQAEMENANLNRVTQLAASVLPSMIKDDADKARYDELLAANTRLEREKHPNYSLERVQAQAIKKTMLALYGKAANPFAAQLAAQREARAQQDQNLQITAKVDNYYDNYFKGKPQTKFNLKEKQGAPTGATEAELIKWGLRSGHITLPDKMDAEVKRRILERAQVSPQNNNNKSTGQNTRNWQDLPK